jgi:ABC-type Fe3+/spermidine/putrescine transport system ATPase subunit
MVFQSYAVFPHMTVAQNVAYGLEARKLPVADIAQRVQKALERVQLAQLGERYASQLSGGQKQRVGLARAMVIEPTLLLMDEPLSNLDAKLRLEMRQEIRLMQRELGITTLYVTHDQEEALAVSDRIAVMHEGRMLQLADPQQIYQQPAHAFVMDFVGGCVWVEGRLAVHAGGGLCFEGGDVQGVRRLPASAGTAAQAGRPVGSWS